MRTLSKIGKIALISSLCLLMTALIATLSSLTIEVSLLISFVAGLLVFLMIDPKSDVNPGEKTLNRLIRGGK